MKNLLIVLAFGVAGLGFAQTQINPTTQIRWPNLTSHGAPSAPSFACTSANYGQPYTDLTANVAYTCSTSGWVSASGGAALPSSAIVFGLSTTTARAAVPSDIGTLLGTIAGGSCTDPSKVYSPGTGACIASGGSADFASPPAIGNTTPTPFQVTGNSRTNCADISMVSGYAGGWFCNPYYFFDSNWVAGAHGLTGQLFSTGASGPGAMQTGTGPMFEGNSNGGLTFRSNFANAGGHYSLNQFSNCAGGGDCIDFNRYWANTGGVMYPSDQGMQHNYDVGGEGLFPTLVVASASGTTITFSSASCNDGNAAHICEPGPGNWLTEATVASGHLTGPSTAFSVGPVSWIKQLPTSGGLPTTSVYGYNTSVNINPGTVGSGNSFENQQPETVTFTGGLGSFAANDHVCVVGSGSQGYGWVEESIVTSVSGSSPTQTIHLPLGRPASSIYMSKGGCLVIGFDANLAVGNNRTAYVGLPSLDGINLPYTVEAYGQTNFATLPQAGQDAEVTSPAYQTSHVYAYGDKFFDGTNVEQVIASGTSGSSAPSWPSIGSTATWGSTTIDNMGPVSNFHLNVAARVWHDNFAPCSSPHQNEQCWTNSIVVGPNMGTWTPGATVYNPNFDVMATQTEFAGQQCYTVGVCIPYIVSATGLGFNGDANSIFNLYNGNPRSMYFDSNGAQTGVTPPNLFNVNWQSDTNSPGIFNRLFHIATAPVSSIFTFGGAPSTTSQGYYLVDNNYAGHPPNIYMNGDGNVEISGGVAAQGPVSGTTLTGVAGFINVQQASGALQGELGFNPIEGSPTSYIGLWKSFGGNTDLSLSSVARTAYNQTLTPDIGLRVDHLVVGGASNGPLEVSSTSTENTVFFLENSKAWANGLTGTNSGAYTGYYFFLDASDGKSPFALSPDSAIVNGTLAWSNGSGDGFPFDTPVDVGLSRDSAGVVDVGNGTAGDKSGSMVMANLTDSALTSGNCIQAGTGGLLTTTGIPCGGGMAHGQYYWSFPSYASDGVGSPVSSVYYLPNGLSSVAATAVARFNGTCTTYPVMTILDLGTSAGATSGTTLLTVTTTATGVFTTSGTVSVSSGHYLGIAANDTISCTLQNDLDVTVTY